ncbi:DnaB-like helicase C-terminal domain-containing protein [Vibrio cholerae]|uniref:DnaB-like helicase C-terminal domain-containing protein n=2 Tax=Vibrio cholerae TaxID=666 RepID=UPI000AC43779|nr:DnaB-like helicase C-terminal domain-containing protein [Vibrio cholerae]
MSLDLLKIMESRDKYERYSPFVREHTVDPSVWKVIQEIKTWFKEDEDREEIDWGSFSTWFCTIKFGHLSSDKLDIYRAIFDKLPSHVVDATLERSIIDNFITRGYCTALADKALRGAEGEPVTVYDLQKIVDDLTNELGLIDELDSFVVEDSLEDIVKRITTGGYDWRINFLNKSVGRMPEKGKLVVFVARPNAGKTTFMAYNATGFASQMPEDKVVLWFNNEEDGGQVKLRTVQAAINWPSADIELAPSGALSSYEDYVGNKDKIKIIDKADISVHDVEQYIKKYNVGLIVIDQLWKVHGFERETANEVARQTKIFNWAREIAKKYASVMVTHQADAQAEGQKWLDMSMMYGSKTAAQGEADTIIMMGRTHEESEKAVRFLTIAKNKNAVGPDVDPSLREGRAELLIVGDTAEFKEF